MVRRSHPSKGYGMTKDEALKHVDESEIQEMPYYEVEAE